MALLASAASSVSVLPRNNFTFIMLAAAGLVSIRHSAILLGPDAPTAALAAMPAVGVFVLFAISGYLVAGSWQRRPAAGRYLADRLVRILPGLAVVVLVAVVLIGPLTTSLPLDEYARDPVTWQYLLNIALNPQYSLPGVFTENLVSSAVNGTLWSIPAQVAAYVTIPVIGVIGARSVRAGAWAAVGIASALLWYVPVMSEIVVWGTQLSHALLVLPCFFAGAMLRELPRLPSIRVGVAVGAVAGLGYLVMLVWVPSLQHIAGWTLLPLAVVLIGRASFPVVRGVGRWGNPAYGVFLAGFLVQQALIDGYGTSLAWVSLGVTLLLSFTFGYVVLHVVEQPLISRVHRWTRSATPGVTAHTAPEVTPVAPPPLHGSVSGDEASAQVAADRRG